MGLELAVSELLLGRLSEEQLRQFRRLAEATTGSVAGGNITNPEEFARTNEEFHEYLFMICDNPMLLESYRRLDVHAQMAAALEAGTPIFERVTQDHLDIVDAFERGDKDRLRAVITAHAHGAKDTMAGAIDAKAAG
jgi:benzoate/toluate 1,2-dioxygenase reductase component